jgi:hypothetical protein
MQKFDHNIGFEKNANFCRRKLSEIAENCDHNIGPRSLYVHWIDCPLDIRALSSIHKVCSTFIGKSVQRFQGSKSL